MALKGNLRDFSITQLFNLIHLARKTGLLTIQGASETAQIYFREGKLSYAQIGQTPNDLATVLYRKSQTECQPGAHLARARQRNDR